MLVAADGSANRMMGSTRFSLPGNWPLFYRTAGRQCYDLDPALAGKLIARIAEPVASGGPGTTCSRNAGQAGDHIAPFWDAVVPARAVVRARVVGVTGAA